MLPVNSKSLFVALVLGSAAGALAQAPVADVAGADESQNGVALCDDPIGACCFPDCTCLLLTAAECAAAPCHGDCNCDGRVSFADINPFVLALSDFAAWQQAYPGCAPETPDLNHDGRIDFQDINVFVCALAVGGGVCNQWMGPGTTCAQCSFVSP